MRLVAKCSWFIGALLCCASSFGKGEEYDPNVEIMTRVDLFAFGSVGACGNVSKGEMALTGLLNAENPLPLLVMCYEKSGAVGKCYTLAALREIDRSVFATKVSKLRKSKMATQTIEVVRGGVIEKQLVSDVILRIENGGYKLWFSDRLK